MKSLIIAGLLTSISVHADGLNRLREMLDRHPAIESASASGRARESGATSSLLRYPDPEIEVSTSRGKEDMYELLPEAGLDRRIVRGSEVLIRQPIPFPGKGTVASRLQSSLAGEQGLRTRLLRNRMAREYLTLLGRRAQLEQQIAYTKQTRAQVETVRELAAIQYSAGKGSLVDVASAKVRENELSIAVSDLNADLAAIGHQLAYFERSGTPAMNDLEFRSALQALAQRVTEGMNIRDRSLELKVTLEGARRADINDTLAKMEFLPDFELFTAYGSMTRRSAGYKESVREKTVRAGVNIRLPLWSALSGVPGIAEKRHDLNAARLEADNVAARIAADLASSREKMKGLLTGIDLHRNSLIPGAMSAHQAARINYAAGKTSFREVVETLSAHLDHELSLVEHELLYQGELLKAAEALDAFFEEARQ